MKTILPPDQINPCSTIQFDQIDYTKPIGLIEHGEKGFLVKQSYNTIGSAKFSVRAKRDFGNGNGWADDSFLSLKSIMDLFYKDKFKKVQFIQFDSDQEFFEWLAED